MTKKEYQAYLGSHHWRMVKQLHRKHGLDSCKVCGCKPVQYHHLNYWCLNNEKIGDLVPLCDKHHEMVHVIEKEKACGLVAAMGALSRQLGIPLGQLTVRPKQGLPVRWQDMGKRKRNKKGRVKKGYWPELKPEKPEPFPVLKERPFVPKWRDYVPSPPPSPWKD